MIARSTQDDGATAAREMDRPRRRLYFIKRRRDTTTTPRRQPPATSPQPLQTPPTPAHIVGARSSVRPAAPTTDESSLRRRSVRARRPSPLPPFHPADAAVSTPPPRRSGNVGPYRRRAVLSCAAAVDRVVRSRMRDLPALPGSRPTPHPACNVRSKWRVYFSLDRIIIIIIINTMIHSYILPVTILQ